MISKAADLIGFSVTFLFLNTSIVGLRLLSRRISAARLWWDDAFIVISLVLSYGSYTFIFIAVRNGMGKHASIIAPHEESQAFKVICTSPPTLENKGLMLDKTIYASEIHYPITMTIIKTSILLFYLRLFGVRKWFRRVLYVTESVVVCWCIATVFAAIFRCSPVRYGFLPVTKQTISHCINIDTYLLATSVLNVVVEFWILLLPLSVVWTLQLPNKQKVAVSCIFLLGAFICGASIARAITVSNVNPLDITWSATTPVIWSNIEVSVAIICACLPVLGPLVQAVNRKVSRRTDTSNQASWPSQSSPNEEAYGLQQYSTTDRIHRGTFLKLDKEPCATPPTADWLLDNRGSTIHQREQNGEEEDDIAVATSRARQEYSYATVP